MEVFSIFGAITLKGADKVKKDLKNVTGEAQQTTSKLSKVGSIAKGVGKSFLVASGVAVAGAVKLVKSISSEYGRLQQNIGGIETLFGESADKVIKNANNAYKTAGISANDYMQQVTSFSASLLQALDGDTEKASESADMAVRDMADNANKMGTHMTDIQNAYQGFSKQNYTMLDNLKLGYGGTKTEMQRLLKDAQKISGVKYNIKNLDDVYQAIHVIQQEMGITGTTAKEAGETIEGSFNSLGASWKNFIAGLGDPNADMKQLVDNLASGINGAIKNTTPIIENIVKVLPTVVDALLKSISDLLPSLIKTFTELVTKVLNVIVKIIPEFTPMLIDSVITLVNCVLENLPAILNGIVQLVIELIKAIGEVLPSLLPVILEAVKQIVLLIVDNLPLLIDAGVKLIMALIDGIVEAIPVLLDMLPTIVEKVARVVMENLPILLNAVLQIALAIANALIKSIPLILKALPKVLKAVVKGMAKSFPEFIKAGKDLIKNLLKGISNSFKWVVNFFKKSFKSLISFITNPFDTAYNFIYKKCSSFVDFFVKIINNLKEAWHNFTNFLKSAIKLPHFKFSGSMNPVEWVKGNMPKIDVEWYKDGGVMNKPTLFGVNPNTGNAMVGGENGAEAIAPIDTLQKYVGEAVKNETDGLNYTMNKLITMLSKYLPEIIDGMDKDIVLDSGALVGKTARKMDRNLGNIATSKARYGV